MSEAQWRACIDFGEGGVQYIEADDEKDAQRRLLTFPAVMQRVNRFRSPDAVREPVAAWVEVRSVTPWRVSERRRAAPKDGPCRAR